MSSSDDRQVGSEFGRWRFRAPGSVVIESPFGAAGPASWAATVWWTAARWQRQLWRPDPAGRGWVLPAELAAGDVVEFGSHSPAGPVLWWGVLDSYEFDRWVTVQGPYGGAALALADAQRLLAADRYLPPLAPAPAAGGDGCGREPRRRAQPCHR